MKGTTTILRLLFGREAGVDREGEQLFRGSHIFTPPALPHPSQNQRSPSAS